MEWTERELKLWALALNVSASKGEIDNAATMIVRSLRERKILFENLSGKKFFTHEKGHYESETINWGATVIPFGKYKGQTIRSVPPDYLLWLRHWINEGAGKQRDFRTLLTAINKYLGDT